MSEAPLQLELDLMTPDTPLSGLVVSGKLCENQQEVEYQIFWTDPKRKQQMERVWLDSIWSIPHMQAIILDVLLAHIGMSVWTRPLVQKSLNRVRVTYGSQDPF